MDLTTLNDRQKEAVLHLDGPALVIAGAGSGKTRVLTYRIANLIHNHQVKSGNILAITFTNKAANEMRERVDQLVDFDVKSMWIGTFHSIGVRILRRHIDLIGYSSNFIIFDAEDQKIVVKECLIELDLDPKKYDMNTIRSIISNEKNKGVTPNQYIEENFSNFRSRNIGEIYKLYENKLMKSNALDFDDLLVKTLEILTKHQEIREYYCRKFQYILVDEYQDTNKVQYSLIKILGKKIIGLENVFVVGDEDQSIYGWRGADIQNILDFEKDFEQAKVIKLERNYRSTQTILEVANSVISNNVNRIGKKLWTEDNEGDKVQIYISSTEKTEALHIAERIYNERNIHLSNYNDMAVLVRTRAQTRAIEERFIMEGIPYKIVGGQEFYGRKEIKDLMAYLKLIQNPHENFSFKRVVNIPKRGIGKKSLENLEIFASERGLSLYDAAEKAKEAGLPKQAVESLTAFTSLISEMISYKDSMTLFDLVEKAYDESGYMRMLEHDMSIEGQARVENLNEFLSAVRDFEDRSEEKTLEDFLVHISLLSDIEKTDEVDRECVTIMTVHSAKGLEYDIVIVAGLEEKMFPITRDDEEDIEEERRLFYVAITRAKKRLYLTLAQQRLIYGNYLSRQKSRFIDEIPEILINSNIKKDEYSQHKDLNNKMFMGGFSSYSEKFEDFPSDLEDNINKIFKVGDKIQHTKWGVGRVVQIRGDEITVAFDNMGIKIMMLPYAPIKKIT
jgi:DNA helicase II / ATP-dependent DNA helicase PcrA